MQSMKFVFEGAEQVDQNAVNSTYLGSRRSK